MGRKSIGGSLLAVLVLGALLAVKLYIRFNPEEVPTKVSSEQLAAAVENFSEASDKFPEAIRTSIVTKSCIDFMSKSVPWPDAIANQPALVRSASMASCACITNSISGSDAFGKLKTALEGGSTYEAEIEKYPELTEKMMKDCGS